MKVYSMIYLMILIMYYIYIWSKLKVLDFSASENDFYFRTEGLCLIRAMSCSVRADFSIQARQ
jgi:hypothetical protein